MIRAPSYRRAVLFVRRALPRGDSSKVRVCCPDAGGRKLLGWGGYGGYNGYNSGGEIPHSRCIPMVSVQHNTLSNFGSLISYLNSRNATPEHIHKAVRLSLQ